jgi:hypothetical protein
MPARRRCELVVFIAGCLAFGYVFSSCSKPENKVEIIPTESSPANTSEFSPIPVIDPNADFSKFQHSNAEHARFPCALCHERKDNSVTPKLSGHLPCAGCHVAQFADNKSAICTICHTNPETGIAKTFPVLKSFNVVFDHAKHLRQTNCATCHKPSRNGVALSVPSGLNAHTACFICHIPGAKSGEENIDSCGVCHQPGRSVKISDWAGTFETTPFSHASHKLDCTVCHKINAGASRGNQVGSPIAAMHFARKNSQSCASCHNNKRAFGGDDFSDCRRCHRGNSYKFS